MKLKKIFIKALLLAIPCTAFSASSDALQIERIATQEDGTVILYAKNGWGSTATNACSTTGVLAFKAATAGGKAMLSTALAAQIAQKLVVVATSDTLCTAVGGWAPTVTRVDVLY